MGIGVSIFLIAVGAILAFAVSWSVEGIELDTVGVILMIVGFIGLVVTLVMVAGSGRRRSVAYDDDTPVERRRTVRRDR